jgi:hypothetical protein
MITAVPDPLCIGSGSFYQQVTIKILIKSPFGQTILRSKVTLPRPIQRAQRFVVTTELPQSEKYSYIGWYQVKHIKGLIIIIKIISLKKFDRTHFDRNFIWPNCHRAERCLTKRAFYQKISFGRKVIWPKKLEKGHSIEKQISKLSYLTGMSFNRNVFIDKGTFERKFIGPKKFIWPNGYLTESIFR